LCLKGNEIKAIQEGYAISINLSFLMEMAIAEWNIIVVAILGLVRGIAKGGPHDLY